MTVAQQTQLASKAKAKSVRTFQALLTPYVREVVAGYRVGQTSIDAEARAELLRALRTGYIKAVNSVIKTDLRQYKANDNDPLAAVYAALGKTLNELIVTKAATQAVNIAATSSKWVARTSAQATDQAWSQAEAKAALYNYMQSQKLIISTTESQAIIEGTRRAVVVAVTDTLKQTIATIAEMVSYGDINAAVRLSRKVMKLAVLPASVSQGEILRLIDTGRLGLMTPEVQGTIIANMRDRAAELGSQGKEWIIFGYNTRDTRATEVLARIYPR